jgi:hypothetical protein
MIPHLVSRLKMSLVRHHGEVFKHRGEFVFINAAISSSVYEEQRFYASSRTHFEASFFEVRYDTLCWTLSNYQSGCERKTNSDATVKERIKIGHVSAFTRRARSYETRRHAFESQLLHLHEVAYGLTA